MLERVGDQGVREQIVERAEKLTDGPEKQGKALLGEFAGLRSLRASSQRYRIIYKVERSRVLVLIVAVGTRKQGSRRDIYELAQKLLRARLVDQSARPAGARRTGNLARPVPRLPYASDPPNLLPARFFLGMAVRCADLPRSTRSASTF